MSPKQALVKEIRQWLDDCRFYAGGPGAAADLRKALRFLEQIVAIEDSEHNPRPPRRE